MRIYFSWNKAPFLPIMHNNKKNQLLQIPLDHQQIQFTNEERKKTQPTAQQNPKKTCQGERET